MPPFATRDELDADEANQLREALFDVAEGLLRTGGDVAAADRVDILERLLGEDVCRRLGIYRLPGDFLLSVVIPVYNEVATIEKIIDRVQACGLPCEIVAVDDGSRDGSREVLQRLKDRDGLRVIFHEKNQGKGAALKTGFAHVTGDVVIVQDADLEYDPQDFRLLLQPILENRADVVYGSRFAHNDRRVSPLWHQTGNQVITTLSNIATGLKLTDAETCYKMFRRELIQRIAPSLQERGFGVELEITAKLAKISGTRFYERPISYARRSYAEGKKIGLKDGFRALWCIARY